MQHFPLSPRMSRVILSAAKYDCLVEVLTIISMLFVSPVFHIPQDKRDEFNDVCVLLFFSFYFYYVILRFIHLYLELR